MINSSGTVSPGYLTTINNPGVSQSNSLLCPTYSNITGGTTQSSMESCTYQGSFLSCGVTDTSVTIGTNAACTQTTALLSPYITCNGLSSTTSPFPGHSGFWVPTATRLEEAKSARFSIDEFAGLHENWDGYGAAAISDQVCQNARHFVDMVEATPFGIPAPDISPKPTGTISFEWEAPRAEAYFEIGNTRYSGFIKTDQAEAFFFQGHTDFLDYQIPTLIQSGIAGPPPTSAPTITEIHTQTPWHERLAA